MTDIVSYRRNEAIAEFVRHFRISETHADAQYLDRFSGVARHSTEAHAMEFTAAEFDTIIEDQRRAIRREESNIRSTEKGTQKNNIASRMAIIKMRRRMLDKALKQRARLTELNGDGDD